MPPLFIEWHFADRCSSFIHEHERCQSVGIDSHAGDGLRHQQFVVDIGIEQGGSRIVGIGQAVISQYLNTIV